MTISIIVSVAENGVIGNKGQLAVRLSDDLKRFKRLTMGHPIIMGRKTFASDIQRVLPGRTNIIVTHDTDFAVSGAVVVHSLEAALDVARKEQASEVFVIGGAQLFSAALPSTDQIYLTSVHASVEGDVFFHYDPADWTVVEREDHAKDDKHPFAYTYARLVRVNKAA